MKDFWSRRRDVSRLEAELRANRPAPPARLVETVVERVEGEARRGRSRSPRLAFCGALTALVLSGLAGFGAFGDVAAAFQHAASLVLRPADNGGATLVVGTSAATDQYGRAVAFGDPARSHVGPPGLRRASSRVLVATRSKDGNAFVVRTRFVVDEQAVIAVTVAGREKKTMLERSAGDSDDVQKGKRLRYTVLVPGAVRLHLRIPENLLEAGERYAIVIKATDASGESSRLRVPFTTPL